MNIRTDKEQFLKVYEELGKSIKFEHSPFLIKNVES